MFLEKFEKGNLSFSLHTVGKDIFSRFLNELKSGNVIVSAKVEEELQEMEEADKEEFLESLGVEEAGLNLSLIHIYFKS